MRLTPEVERLTTEIAEFSRLKATAGPEVLDRWAEWGRRIAADARIEWFPETDFKRRTGASGKWCRSHFAACEADGLARLRVSRREWHVSARPPVAPHASDRDALVGFIATSYGGIAT